MIEIEPAQLVEVIVLAERGAAERHGRLHGHRDTYPYCSADECGAARWVISQARALLPVITCAVCHRPATEHLPMASYDPHGCWVPSEHVETANALATRPEALRVFLTADAVPADARLLADRDDDVWYRCANDMLHSTGMHFASHAPGKTCNGLTVENAVNLHGPLREVRIADLPASENDE